MGPSSLCVLLTPDRGLDSLHLSGVNIPQVVDVRRKALVQTLHLSLISLCLDSYPTVHSLVNSLPKPRITALQMYR